MIIDYSHNSANTSFKMRYTKNHNHHIGRLAIRAGSLDRLSMSDFAPRVKAFLMRSGTAEGLAEELVQETMISVWRKAAMFNPAQAAVSTWIFTIARNLRVDHFRRQGQREVQGDGTEADDMPDTAPALEDQVRTGRREKGVREAMCKLSPEQAQIVRLSFYEEHPHSRIALELGIPLGTVKSRVRLAVNHLRRLLDGLEP